jgi:hypothetical protein
MQMAPTANGGFTFPVDQQVIPKCETDPDTKMLFFQAKGYFLEPASNYLLDPSSCVVNYKDSKTGALQTIKGIIKLNNGNAWVVEFSSDGLVLDNNPFTCIVTNLNGDKLKVEFYIETKPHKPRGMSSLLTHVTYPTTPDCNTVPPTFPATGSTNSQNKVSGSLINGMNQVFPGTTTTQGPNWVILFSNIPPGIYTLTVVALPDLTSVSPIVVVPNPNNTSN